VLKCDGRSDRDELSGARLTSHNQEPAVHTVFPTGIFTRQTIALLLNCKSVLGTIDVVLRFNEVP
jgi:hypothetical protein